MVYCSHHSGSFGTAHGNVLAWDIFAPHRIHTTEALIRTRDFFYLGLLVIVPLSILYTIPVIRLLKQQQRYSASEMSGYIICVVFVTVLTVYLFVQVMIFFDISGWALTQTKVAA